MIYVLNECSWNKNDEIGLWKYKKKMLNKNEVIYKKIEIKSIEKK